MSLPANTPTAPESGDDPAAAIETVAIELNFNAFADHVPPTRHARREAKPSDPSLQDFADQALELATLRAEVKRLTRDYELSQNALRVREMRLHALHEELATARRELRNTTQQLSVAQTQLASMSTKALTETVSVQVEALVEIVAPPEAPIESRATELVDTPETSTIVLADRPQAIADAPASSPDANVSGRRLMPLDHVGTAVMLAREIMTIGRTRGNDICIPSGGVSRDHARLLVTPRSVTIVDMNSANGCFVNDEPISKHRLRDGDVLRIGDRSYRFIDG